MSSSLSPSLFLFLFFLLNAAIIRIRADSPSPFFVPPPCNSDVTRYGPLVQAVQSTSLTVSYCVSIDLPNNEESYNCTYLNNTFLPLPTQSFLDPTVGTYSAEVWRGNPEDSFTGQLLVYFNTSYLPPGTQGVSMAFGSFDSQRMIYEWEEYDDPWTSVYLFLDFTPQFQSISLFPNPLDEQKSQYYSYYMILAPQDGYWESMPIWNQSCSIAFETTNKCCSIKQPPLLVLQPYWVIIMSTCAYFVASYALVYLLIILERFEWWRRLVKKVAEIMDVSPVQPNSARRSSTPRARSSSNPSDTPLASGALRDEGGAETARELRNVDDALRTSFRHAYLEPLLDSSEPEHPFADSTDFVASSPASSPRSNNNHLDSKPLFTKHEIAEPDHAGESEKKLTEKLTDRSDFPDVKSQLTISERLSRANSGYLLLQLFIVMCNFCYINFRITVLDHSPADTSKSAWWRYQQVYMFWTNSSMVTLLASALASHGLMKYQYFKSRQLQRPPLEVAQEQEDWENKSCRRCYTCGCCCMCCRSQWVTFKMYYQTSLPKDKLICRHIACCILLLFSPAIITHVIPMWILFFPFLLLAIVILLVLVVIVFVVFYWTEKTADLAYGNIKELYRNRKWKQEAQSPSSADESLSKHNFDASCASADAAAVVADEVGALSETTTKEVNGSASSPQSPSNNESTAVNAIPRVVFPWYAILLLRVLFTITIVVLFQTSYNYGQIVWTNIWPIRDEIRTSLNHKEEFILFVWSTPAVLEFAKRDTNAWVEGMQTSVHQLLTQISLFL